jgi:aminoglycoside 6'-N-acetyltransferase
VGLWAAGVDYLIGEVSHIGQGIGSAAIASFTPHVFASYPDIDVIVAAPQAANSASRRALKKTGFALAAERQLDSDDPSDTGPSAIYTLTRPGRVLVDHPRARGSTLPHRTPRR